MKKFLGILMSFALLLIGIGVSSAIGGFYDMRFFWITVAGGILVFISGEARHGVVVNELVSKFERVQELQKKLQQTTSES